MKMKLRTHAVTVLFTTLCFYSTFAQQFTGSTTTSNTIYRSAAVKVGYGPLYLDWTYENNWNGNANNWAGYIGFNAIRGNNDTKDYYYGDNPYTSKAVFEGSGIGFRWLYRSTPGGSADAGGQHLLTELMRISPTGFVGIGVAPTAKLNINQANGNWNDGIRMSLAGKNWDLVADNNGDRFIIAKNQSISEGLMISNGNVGIGTWTADYKLTVNGKIKAEEVQVVVDVPADYVFEENYQLKPLEEDEKFVKENKHLPGVPDAQTLINNGWQVGEMNNKLLEKVEELTLYMIELKKENEKLKERLEKLEKRR
jgi:hypothetical protein